MAKKAAGSSQSDEPTPVPTPAENARALAIRYAELLEKKKAIEEELESIKEQITEYAKTNSDYDLEAVTVIPGKGKPKIEWGTMTKKMQEQVLTRLKNDLPDFVITKNELDVESLFYAQNTNSAVQNALKVNGVTIADSDTYTVRKVAK